MTPTPTASAAPPATGPTEAADIPAGLTDAEAASRLATEGPNELPRPDRRSLLRIILDTLREPMFGLLVAAGLIYLLLGDRNEALLLLVFACASVALAVGQESRSEKVLDALRTLTSPRAQVVRGGRRQRIAGREVVRGDILFLREGDRVPADTRLLSAQDLQADESLLTGESAPVRKRAAAAVAADIRPGGDDLPIAFSGTLVVRGQGYGEVTATGSRSEIGKIGVALGGIAQGPSRLTLQTRRLVRSAAVIAIVLSCVVTLLYGLARGTWLDGVLAGLALSMAMMPEEFPLVLTIFMVMGAWRLSRVRVLTRRAAAIESLGAATVLCTDKTGTLTQNRMAVADLRGRDALTIPQSPGDGHRLPAPLAAPLADLAYHGLLASAPDPFDPMDQAFHDLAKAAALEIPAGGTLVRQYGLDPSLLAVSQVWARPGGDRLVAAKGAPEAILDLCHADPATRRAALAAVDGMAAQGMRILGVAGAPLDDGPLPSSQRDFPHRFLGLVGLSDPLRPEVAAAVEECRAAGIRVVMVTGDYPATARAIATQAGLSAGELLTGDALARLTPAELAARVGSIAIFARTLPEQKLRIVDALKAGGDIVAMTGDGVNDAPALKAADIGIAMGGRGTDVAREAAAIVLLDDDFGSIVHTMRLGRRIHDNLRKAMGYIIAVHVPIAGLALLPLLFGLPPVLGPVHIAFLEMVIDPVCSVVFEAEPAEADIMRRAPRPPDAPLFSLALVGWSLLQGVVALAVVATLFMGGLARGMPADEARALAYVALVLVNLGLVLVNRTFTPSPLAALLRPNRAFWVVGAVAGGILLLTLVWPPAAELFKFGPLHADDLTVTAAATVGVVMLLELLKPLWAGRLRA
ncbi:cation-translocating P-type ATPase [Nitrospirillum iridis]|uniref:P-type Cu(+) transporter n=1 Tax=Nitrospirillum iridis TaxID=765888 RepID=A0A7X0AU19_9PROT|nr:cation-translocating P-type ATPase [Nitrospirillum iridis]MBB6250102.1 Ca2+-transporting ATPase [Nitrospirillum iridis]